MRRIADLSHADLRRLIPIGFWRSEDRPELPHPRQFVSSGWCSELLPDIGTEDLTDGTFLFPEGLAHYVRVHSVRPDQRFLEHMRSLEFRVPRLAELQLEF